MTAILRTGAFGGVIDLVEGQEEGVVNFTTAQSAAPRSIRLTVETSDGTNIFATVIEESVTAFGFNFDLSGQIPAGGGQLNYLCEI